MRETFIWISVMPVKMFIGIVDVVETKRMEEQALKIKKKEERLAKEKDKVDRMKKKDEEDKKIYKKVKWTSDDSNDDQTENKKEDCDKGLRLGKRRLEVSITDKKRIRMSKDDNMLVGDYLATCERFKVSETAT